MTIPLLGLRRSIAIKLIPKAFASGMSVSAFFRKLRGTTGTYRKTTMLSDWRTVTGMKAKEDALKYIRKDRLPSPHIMIDSHWGYDKEYVYKANTWSRIHPDDPLTERMVTFQSDILLTPTQVEEQIGIKWSEWERYFPEKVERIQVTHMLHITPDPLELE